MRRAEFGVAGAEGDHDAFGIFSKQPEEPLLEPLLQRTALVPQRMPHAASGVNAAREMTGV